jgi:hypothetical protein
MLAPEMEMSFYVLRESTLEPVRVGNALRKPILDPARGIALQILDPVREIALQILNPVREIALQILDPVRGIALLEYRRGPFWD